MKNKLKKTLSPLVSIWVLIFTITGCDKSGKIQIGETSSRVLCASFYEDDESKVSLEDGARMIWHSGDTISVFENVSGRRYKFNGVTGDKKGTFTEDQLNSSLPSTFSKIYAIYPYRSTNSCEMEGKFGVEIPSLQHYYKASFDPAANIMGASTESLSDVNVKFHNALGYLRVKLYGGDVLKSITIRGNCNEVISGSATLSFSGNSVPVLEMTGTGSEIILDCGDGILLPENEKNALCFWIAVPPITFDNDFSLELENTIGEKMVKCTESKVSFVRNYAAGVKPICFSISGGTDFLSFSIISDDGTEYPAYDLSGPNITVCVPFGFNLHNAKACFKINGAYVNVGSATQISGVTENDFSEVTAPIEYKVVGISGLERIYNVRVIDTKLPVVYISTPNHQAIISKEDWVEDGTIKIGMPGEMLEDLGVTDIRGRGNTSWSGQNKKPYTIKLDKKHSFLGMKKHKRWQFMTGFGMFMSYLRDDLLFEMAKRTASHGWAPSGRFVELVLNGEFKGMYWVCEKISVDKNRVNITEITPDDIVEPGLSGGYLMEYVKGDEKSFKSQIYKYTYYIKKPDENVQDVQYNYIKDYINNLEASLIDDSRFASGEYKTLVDVDSWIDYWFLHEVANNTDLNLPAYPGMSCFCYKDRGGKLKAGPVWDMHMSKKTTFHADTALYYKRMFQDPYFVQRVNEKWYGTSTEVGFVNRMGNVIDRVDSISALIEQSGNRDLKLWSKTGSIKQQADDVKKYYEWNMNWLDIHIATDK